MFVYKDGSVTGSVNVAKLKELGLYEEPVTEGADEAADPYEGETVESLRETLRERDLPVSGNKAELIQRLHDADAQEAAPVSPEDDPSPETTEDTAGDADGNDDVR